MRKTTGMVDPKPQNLTAFGSVKVPRMSGLHPHTPQRGLVFSLRRR
jgi:hypothetical protein